MNLIFQKKNYLVLQNVRLFYCVFSFVAGTKCEHEFLNITKSKTTHKAANSTILNPTFQL